MDMRKYLLVIITLLPLFICPWVHAQTTADMRQAFDSIKLSLCKGNIPHATRQLEAFETLYPNEKLLYVTDKILGDIYMKGSRLGDARQKYLCALQASNNSGIVPSLVMEANCGNNLIKYFYSYGPADICVPLSAVYRNFGEIDSSYYYLDLADKKLNPFRGDGTDSTLYRAYLSPYFAEHYIAAGDTTSAINRLLDYFGEAVGDTRKIASSLKHVLQLKYTRTRIKREVNKAIAGMVVTAPQKKGKNGVALMIMFGHPVRIYGAFETTWEAQAAIRKDSRIRMLLQ